MSDTPQGAYSLDETAGGAAPLMTLPGDWRRPSDRSRYTIYWRSSDGYGQILPRPAPQDVPAFYDVEDYYTHGAGAGEAAPRGFAHRLLHHLAWRCDRGTDPTDDWWRDTLGTAPKSVLEIGCGAGDTLSRLKAMGHRARGIEPDPNAAAVAAGKGIAVDRGTAEHIPETVACEQFDVVLMMHVLEHCLDPEQSVRNALDLTAEGGLLIVEVPNNACLGRRWFGQGWYWLDVPRHLNFFTRNSLRTLLETSGCTVQRAEFWGYNRQFSPGWLEAQTQIARALSAPDRGGALSIAAYLARTMTASPERKYDSVRCIAVKAGAARATAGRTAAPATRAPTGERPLARSRASAALSLAPATWRRAARALSPISTSSSPRPIRNRRHNGYGRTQ